ncbi:MAG: DNA primase [Candidatus Andersenbacteria bacterium]|nr:DNA primase [Candidatus Andersenbacteria bacterium]
MLNSQVDEIKSRLSVEEVISGYLQLQRAGRNWKAKCPFHNEKTPSFTVSPERQMWYCFGCNEGGDIFTFVMKMEGLEFRDALKLLAEKAGVQLEDRGYDNSGEKSKALEILDISGKFYQECLKIKTGKKAFKYLSDRGLSKDTIEKFQLGYAPDSWDLLSKFLKKKGYKESGIFSAGMTVKKDKGGYYDRFRGRIMFPINNVSGQTIGFSSRVMPGADESHAKYINTPETVIYNKSRVLYGLDKSKVEIRKKDLCIMVEGNMDVIASFQAEIENVAATSGTALTADQLKIIKRYTDNIAFSFDMDSAGIKAAGRGIELALQEGMSVSVITIPEGKDPADCVKNNPDLWKETVKNPRPIMEFYFESVFAKYDANEVEGKKKIAEELLHIISKISNKIEQNHYIKTLSEKLKVDEKAVFESLNALKQDRSSFKNRIDKNNLEKKETDTREDRLQKRILGFIILYPHFFGDIFLDLDNFLFDSKIKKIYGMIKNLYAEENKLSNEIFAKLKKEISAEEGRKSEKDSLSYLWDASALSIESELDEIDDIHKEIESCIANLKKIVLERELRKITFKIKNEGDNASEEDMQMHKKYADELNELNI